MPNRTLTEAELASARELLAEIFHRLEVLSGGDPELLFAFRRKIGKELIYGERSSPSVRRRLKAKMRATQGGRCAECGEPLPERYCVLDRKSASAGYVEDNVRLLCEPCDRRIQVGRGYK